MGIKDDFILYGISLHCTMDSTLDFFSLQHLKMLSIIILIDRREELVSIFKSYLYIFLIS